MDYFFLKSGHVHFWQGYRLSLPIKCWWSDLWWSQIHGSVSRSTFVYALQGFITSLSLNVNTYYQVKHWDLLVKSLWDSTPIS